MNNHCVVSVTKNESAKGITQTYFTAHSPSIESGQNSLTIDCSSPHPSPFKLTEYLSSPNNLRSPTVQLPKYCSKSGADVPLSPGSHIQNSKSTCQQSSVFCTSLYLSSSSISETNRQLGNLPFLPYPPTYKRFISDVGSAKPFSLCNGNFSNSYDDEEHSDAIMKDFFYLPGDTSEGTFHGKSCSSDNLALEQLDLQFLSDELDIAITDHGENPRVDEIYETCDASNENIELFNQKFVPMSPSVDAHSSHPCFMSASVHKPRMRWTPELHECFIEAVNKLGGTEIWFYARYLQKILEEQQKAVGTPHSPNPKATETDGKHSEQQDNPESGWS